MLDQFQQLSTQLGLKLNLFRYEPTLSEVVHEWGLKNQKKIDLKLQIQVYFKLYKNNKDITVENAFIVAHSGEIIVYQIFYHM